MAEEIIDEDVTEIPDAKVLLFDEIFRKSENYPSTRNHGKKSSGKHRKDLASLPSVRVYELDINELNRQYGENDWRIVYWHAHPSVECIPTRVYERVSYAPVISVGLEHELCSIKREKVLVSNSIASVSLAALIVHHKFFLALPVYRQETYFKNLGLPCHARP